MNTALLVYILIGGIVALPVADNVTFPQLLLIIVTWPIAVIYSISKYFNER